MLADKGYDAQHNHTVCREELGIPSTVIPIKGASVGPPLAQDTISTADETSIPEAQYRQRSHAESGFSRHKRRLGSALTARHEPTQFRELRLRVLTHNRMLIAA